MRGKKKEDILLGDEPYTPQIGRPRIYTPKADIPKINSKKSTDRAINSEDTGQHQSESGPIQHGAMQREVETWQEDARCFASAFTHAAIGMVVVSPEGRFLQVNRAFCALTGYSQSALMALDFQSITHPDDIETDLEYVGQLVRGEIESYQMEKRYQHQMGYWLWVLLSVSLIRDSTGAPWYFISQVQDISARKQLEAERQAHSEAMRALVENASDIITRYDLNLRVLYANPAIKAITGRAPSSYLGKTLGEAGLPASFVREFEANLREALEKQQALSRDYLSSNGVAHFHGRFIPEFNRQGQVASILVIARDITEIKAAQIELMAAEERLKTANQELAQANEQLKTLAHYDGLTGLENRRRFDEQLSEAIERAQLSQRRGETWALSLIILDIDHFKRINDTLGHAAGDDVIRRVGQLLRHTLRPSDVVARYGGEEFALLLFETDEIGSQHAAQRCRQAIAHHPWSPLPVSASLGVTTWTGEDAQTMLARADLALYAAKRAGRNCVRHSAHMASGY